MSFLSELTPAINSISFFFPQINKIPTTKCVTMKGWRDGSVV